MQYIVYLPMSGLVSDLLIVGRLDCRHVCNLSAVCIINELLQKRGLFLKGHVTTVSAVVILCYSSQSSRMILSSQLRDIPGIISCNFGNLFPRVSLSP